MLEKGWVIRSVAGRDKGKLMLVLDVIENGVLVSDGKERPLERPKFKNLRHIEATQYRIDTNEAVSNRRLRRLLRDLDGNVIQGGF